MIQVLWGDRMISLNYRDGRPIYEQIREQFQRLIVSGALGEGEKMPSVRELAAALSINPNTIQRAYRELEHAGYITSVAGKGSFVGMNPQTVLARKTELLQALRSTAAELRMLGATPGELREAIEAPTCSAEREKEE